MPYTVYIEETNRGFVEFETLEDAEDFVNDPDYDLVKWTHSEGETEIVKEDVTV